jgi:probable selenium-dependent hydroxylase accessory protein YqeC
MAAKVTPEEAPVGDLAAALGLGDHELVSIVGGGGKTSTLFALGRQLGGRVVLTTTTKMSRDRRDGIEPLLGPSDEELVAVLDRRRVALVWGALTGGKAVGVDPATCDRWFGMVDHVLVEADGARRRPLTAPGPFEPVVPRLTTAIVACVGAAALGRVIADACHRPMRVAALAGCSPAQRLTPERLAKIVASPRGLAKGRPDEASYTLLVVGVTAADRSFVDEVRAEVGDRARVLGVRHEPVRRR